MGYRLTLRLSVKELEAWYLMGCIWKVYRMISSVIHSDIPAVIWELKPENVCGSRFISMNTFILSPEKKSDFKPTTTMLLSHFFCYNSAFLVSPTEH